MDVIVSSAQALWQVVAVGLLLGAGLPALFAFGLRFWYRAGHSRGADGVITRPPGATAAAVVCFSVVALATLFGIVVIIFGNQLFG
ncbi:hypothetical protein [Microlunatus parietis]|uniref:Uncharacterized protein n=1 Tax=Microlunatus parietis TaxID=682979 RepID=A0A7Y9I3J7_9ACTN|nr:hypothetical protein [Microlunatus parietis]NYE69289.1 hypothetical protein [Microlunatus parietis]